MKKNTKLIITILMIILICNFADTKKNLRRDKTFMDSVLEFVFGSCVSANGVIRGHSEGEFSPQEIRRCNEKLQSLKNANRDRQLSRTGKY